ncbi:MAG: ArsA family ATPase [Acidimicrobiales bacterium]
MNPAGVGVGAAAVGQGDGGGIGALVAERSMVVCCGPGGVGKTTVAGALAVDAARQGRRSVVVTIDPARRLADAMGLGAGGLPDTPRLVAGDWPGELWALMLDSRSTFDSLVVKYAPDPQRAEAILANRFYRNVAGALSGTQEYMAMEKLFELHDEGRFDLVVVDTPPTRNALDFVDAPRRLTRFLENRVFRLLMMPARTSFRAVNVATQSVLRSVSRVVGSELVADAVAFFQAFEGMEDGFRQRAQRVRDLMGDPGTAFVLVSAPRGDAMDEAAFLADKLAEAAIPVAALVVNRVHPRFAPASATAAGYRRRAAEHDGSPLGGLYSNLADLTALADDEAAHVASLAERIGRVPVASVPLLASDVHDLAGLAEVGAYVVAG